MPTLFTSMNHESFSVCEFYDNDSMSNWELPRNHNVFLPWIPICHHLGLKWFHFHSPRSGIYIPTLTCLLFTYYGLLYFISVLFSFHYDSKNMYMNISFLKRIVIIDICFMIIVFSPFRFHVIAGGDCVFPKVLRIFVADLTIATWWVLTKRSCLIR